MMVVTDPPRLLKPDRTIVTPDSPGWDDAIPDRPRAGRARWWRKLLAGRAKNTMLQPGGCATPCGTPCGGGIACSFPCPDPPATIMISWDFTSSEGDPPTGSGSGTLTYDDGSLTWIMPCQSSGLTGNINFDYISAFVDCELGSMRLTVNFWQDSGCTMLGTQLIFNSAGCTAPQCTCDPFAISWVGTFSGSFTTYGFLLTE